MDGVLFPEIEVQLSCEDGNVYLIIARVSRALRRAGLPDSASRFSELAFASSSYDEVLQWCTRYVTVL